MEAQVAVSEPEITPCRLIYPYYENPTMLEMQVENWNRYAGELRSKVRLIVVDDCSEKYPAEPILRKCKIPKRLFRVSKRIPWNMHQARNIGALEACKRAENFWMFMSDIDIILTPEAALTMLTKTLDGHYHYTMERVFAPEFTERKVHPNTFLVKHAAYWMINGYDLDLTGGYGGGYGGDGEFRRQLSAICPARHMDDVVLVGYGRRQRNGVAAIADADTTNYDRDEWQKKYRDAFNRKRIRGDMRSTNPIRVDYAPVPLAPLKEDADV
ncbi:MAG: hypothetical protein HC793_00325 [Aquincola sp.]|nr:hypothetical protein [Aquincola sp.]